MNVEKQNQGNHNRQSHQRFAWFESTLRVKRIDFRLYQNDLYRNDFVSKQPDTVCIIVSQRKLKSKTKQVVKRAGKRGRPCHHWFPFCV